MNWEKSCSFVCLSSAPSISSAPEVQVNPCGVDSVRFRIAHCHPPPLWLLKTDCTQDSHLSLNVSHTPFHEETRLENDTFCGILSWQCNSVRLRCAAGDELCWDDSIRSHPAMSDAAKWAGCEFEVLAFSSTAELRNPDCGVSIDAWVIWSSTEKNNSNRFSEQDKFTIDINGKVSRANFRPRKQRSLHGI